MSAALNPGRLSSSGSRDAKPNQGPRRSPDWARPRLVSLCVCLAFSVTFASLLPPSLSSLSFQCSPPLPEIRRLSSVWPRFTDCFSFCSPLLSSDPAASHSLTKQGARRGRKSPACIVFRSIEGGKSRRSLFSTITPDLERASPLGSGLSTTVDRLSIPSAGPKASRLYFGRPYFTMD